MVDLFSTLDRFGHAHLKVAKGRTTLCGMRAFGNGAMVGAPPLANRPVHRTLGAKAIAFTAMAKSDTPCHACRIAIPKPKVRHDYGSLRGGGRRFR